MKLLIITQKVDQNDPILGFFHNWLIELASNLPELKVICLQKGLVSLPANVEIKSLGKENCNKRIIRFINFFRLIWQWRNGYSHVFVHMNVKYIILAGWWWKLMGKKISLWHTHKSVGWQLIMAEKFCDKIFTASEKSFRLSSKKVKIVGHGIDTDLFKPINQKKEYGLMLCVGRISQIKNQLNLVKIFHRLLKNVPEAHLVIIGQPILKSDNDYLQEIKNYIKQNKLENNINYFGPEKNDKLPLWYNRASLTVNLSETGSLDKDVLEAAACGCPIITMNEAFNNLLPNECLATNLDQIEDKIKNYLISGNSINLRNWVVKNHNLKNLIKILLTEMSK